MSTRCQIGFYKSEKSNINKPYALIYKHSDGYPDYTLPLLVDILGKFEARRGLDDEEYLPAWVSWFLINNTVESQKEWIKKSKEGGYPLSSPEDGITCLGHGLCFDKKFHGDIEFYYRITPQKLHVYEAGFDKPPEEWKEIHTIELKDLEKKLPTLIGICEGLDEFIAERMKA
jgi:hypothetical protein